MSTPTDVRLRAAVQFSVVCLVAMVLGSRAFDVRLGPYEGERALSMLVPALALGLASVSAIWLLLAALLERRSALSDTQGRRLWAWTLVFCITFVILGLMSSASSTIGQGVMYASGLLVGVIGLVGLVVSALPRWRRR